MARVVLPNDFVIAMCGPIGSGKTTLAAELGALTGLPVFNEPVADNVYLKDFYADMKSVAFQMQIYLLIKRLKQQQSMSWNGLGGVMDRSIYEDPIFATMLTEMGMITQRDLDTYIELFTMLSHNMLRKPSVIVYLHVTPEKCLERVQTRNRTEEKSMTLEYLTALCAAYDKFIMQLSKTIPVLKVDWNDFGDVHKLAIEIKTGYEEMLNIHTLKSVPLGAK
jgi:deoxyadenosine/deoxycytidine kinase